ncbi:MAG: tetratricopeptide repeat protein, partial [Deltaproteobacteria bacterium]|nr:tetratricopeptide repeat protein [Deltaproteobacteria bacterium]
QRVGLSIVEDREVMERILADANGASPQDRAWSAANLAQLARSEGELSRNRSMLLQAIQLDPSEVSFRLQAARLDLEELELERARRLLEEALQGAPGCAPCRELLAEVQIARGDAAAALALLEKDAPRTAWVSCLRGKAYLLLDRLQEASDHLAAAQTQQRDQLESSALLALVRVLLGNRRGGMEALRTLERARPGEPAVLLALAIALRHQGALDQARGYLGELLKLRPRPYEAWTELCRLEIMAAFGGPALTACQAALRNNPSYLPAWGLVAGIHEAEGRTGEAENAYRKVAEQLSGDPRAVGGLISCMLSRDRDAEAARLLGGHAAALGPAAHFYRGLIAERAGKMDEAVTELRAASLHAPLAKKALSALGRAYLSQGREAQARSALEQAAQGPDGDTGAQLLLGDLALKADRLEDAASHYQTTLMLLDRRLHRSEDEAAALYGLGEAFFRRGSAFLGSARTAFQRAAKADARDGSSRLRLGEIGELEGNEEQAVAYYREAIAVDPDLIRAYWFLGRLLQKRGEKDGARQALQEYLRRMPRGGNVQEAHTLLEKLGQ